METTTVVNIPAAYATRVEVVQRLLASARALGRNPREIRRRRGGWDAPYEVAVHAGYITPDEPDPVGERLVKRRPGRPRKRVEGSE